MLQSADWCGIAVGRVINIYGKYAPVAQLVDKHLPFKQGVARSNRARRTRVASPRARAEAFMYELVETRIKIHIRRLQQFCFFLK